MCRKIFLILISAVVVFGVSEASFALMCGGHSQHQQSAQAESGGHLHAQHEAVTQATPKEAVSVGNKICPVSGEKISTDTESGMAPASYEYEGRIYNFCCAGCIEKFKQEPEKYIQKVEEGLVVEPGGG